MSFDTVDELLAAAQMHLERQLDTIKLLRAGARMLGGNAAASNGLQTPKPQKAARGRSKPQPEGGGKAAAREGPQTLPNGTDVSGLLRAVAGVSGPEAPNAGSFPPCTPLSPRSSKAVEQAGQAGQADQQDLGTANISDPYRDQKDAFYRRWNALAAQGFVPVFRGKPGSKTWQRVEVMLNVLFMQAYWRDNLDRLFGLLPGAKWLVEEWKPRLEDFLGNNKNHIPHFEILLNGGYRGDHPKAVAGVSSPQADGIETWSDDELDMAWDAFQAHVAAGNIRSDFRWRGQQYYALVKERTKRGKPTDGLEPNA